MPAVLRLCLDLNIWCAALLADQKGKQGTASQLLVESVRLGYCSLGPVQLVISWGMLNRLELVLEEKLGIAHLAANSYVSAIREYAELGPSGVSPQLTLGGTGVVALSDTEDAHVLETALAGRVSVLVTCNLKDFKSNDTQVAIAEQHLIYKAPAHTFHIFHPKEMMNWLRRGEMPRLVLK